MGADGLPDAAPEATSDAHTAARGGSSATGQIQHHSAFTATDLASRARGAGEVISVVIPALNEEATVGAVVASIHDHLVSRVGLVHEVLVVDADSTDDTAAVAAAAGARVVRQSEVLPQLGTAPGKGEAMWKGLAAATGSLLVFLDADVVDVGPHFVTGLLGPLLTDPGIELTKAAYDRPYTDAAGRRQGVGGRVSELMVRPAIALWFPELAGVVQPLAGEVAARRSLLETLPFVRGYGVEIAMLIDVARRCGPAAIAQVDLDQRTHGHQDLPALGRMATELLQVMVARCDSPVPGSATTTDQVQRSSAVTLWQPQRDATGHLDVAPHNVEVTERPPLREVASR